MKKIVLSVVLSTLLYLAPTSCFAWGAKGHGIVAQIAFRYLDDSVKLKVKKFLGNLTIEEAANWMDDSKSNSYFDYMRSWHYLDIDKGEKYVPSAERNIVTIMYSAIAELRSTENLKRKDIRRDLLLLFHLVGDLHQPLHTGYVVDKGGNTINVTAQNFASNLHSAWDTQILETEGISLERCIKMYETLSPQKIDSIKKISVMAWMYQSRTKLDMVYDFQNGFLNREYIDRSVPLIEYQLLCAGLRLASILKESFTNRPFVVLNNFYEAFPYAAVQTGHQTGLFGNDDGSCEAYGGCSHG
ncbi:MAG: S1/P1 nuclease [Ferruginibacter sp.]